jgi:hypothetical protein
MSQCAKLVAESNTDLRANIKETLAIVIRTLYLFHERCPPQDSVVCELIETTRIVELQTYDALDRTRADKVKVDIEQQCQQLDSSVL